MRKELLYKPGLLVERLALLFEDKRRLSRLKNTVASGLSTTHITALEFLEIARDSGTVRTIFDLGANVGTWSQLARAVVPDAAIHAFEPIPQYQQEFLKNNAEIKNLKLHKVGAGGENKKEKFNFAGHSSSFLEVTENITNMFPGEKKAGEFVVDMIRLDDYVRAQGIPKPDLMKLDVEGYELEVLGGAVDCMKTCRYIILEVSFIERHRGQPLFHDVVAFMAKNNFEVFAFPHKMALGQRIIMTDVLFKNKNL